MLPSGRFMGRYSYEVENHSRRLESQIRHLPDEELRAIRNDIMGDTLLREWYPKKCARVLDEIARVEHWRHENRKRNELRDALILFLNGNANLGGSLEHAADRIADAIENAGGSFSGSVDEIASILQDMRSDVGNSDLPELISEMRDAMASRRRRLT
jgi:hypothetical protein